MCRMELCAREEAWRKKGLWSLWSWLLGAGSIPPTRLLISYLEQGQSNCIANENAQPARPSINISSLTIALAAVG